MLCISASVGAVDTAGSGSVTRLEGQHPTGDGRLYGIRGDTREVQTIGDGPLGTPVDRLDVALRVTCWT